MFRRLTFAGLVIAGLAMFAAPQDALAVGPGYPGKGTGSYNSWYPNAYRGCGPHGFQGVGYYGLGPACDTARYGESFGSYRRGPFSVIKPGRMFRTGNCSNGLFCF